MGISRSPSLRQRLERFCRSRPSRLSRLLPAAVVVKLNQLKRCRGLFDGSFQSCRCCLYESLILCHVCRTCLDYEGAPRGVHRNRGFTTKVKKKDRCANLARLEEQSGTVKGFAAVCPQGWRSHKDPHISEGQDNRLPARREDEPCGRCEGTASNNACIQAGVGNDLPLMSYWWPGKHLCDNV